MNPYCLAANDMDMRMLIKQTSPSQLERERAASGSVPSAVLVFDQVLRDVTPPRPLHMLPYSHHRDPVKRHGAHYQEIRSAQVKTSVLNSKLKELYDTWQHRPPHPPTTDDKVEVLKRTSRLVHFCESPLLFHPDWRRRLGTIPPGVTTDRPVEDKTTDEPPPEQDNNWSSNPPPTNSTPAPPPGEEKWHKELLMAYVQQYVQYMQSLQFVVVQTRPQSPKQSKSRSRHQFVSGRVRREHSGAVARKQSTSKESRDNLPKHFRRYLQKTSIGGIILMELSFQDCYFCVKLYALECSRIPSDKPINAQVRCMFTEECCRYKDLIHVLSFNYDLHLRNAQSFLGGRQMIFNKGYRVADMLGELLRLHPEDPGFVCNHLRRGEVAVPCEPNVCSVKVFKYIVKNSSQYDFTIVKMKALESKKHEAALLGSISQNRWNEGRMFPSLLENNDYDVTLLVTLKDKYEGGVLHLEYFVLMTSRRELFPKLTADNSIPWTMSSSSFRSSSSSSGKSKSIPESGSVEVAPEKGGRVRFSLPRQPATTADPKRQVAGLSSSGEFHRSASTPHSLYALAHDSFPFPPVLHAQSDENLYGKKIPLGNNPKSGSPTTTDGLQEKFLNREERLLSDATEKAHDLLLHVVCRAQTHCNRDLLWYRLLAISEDEKDAGEKAKRVRKKSEYRRPTLDLAATWCRNGCLQSLLDEQELHTPHRLSLDNLKYLLSVVHRTSLKGEEDLVPLLSMNVTWYLNLIRVLMARFSDIYRLYSSEDGRVHYLAILNPNNLDMFVYLHVDESSDTADMFTVFREMPRLEEARPGDGQHFSRSVREHLYSVINAVCFHSWAGLLPK